MKFLRRLWCRHTYEMLAILASPESRAGGYGVMVLQCRNCDKDFTVRVKTRNEEGEDADTDPLPEVVSEVE